MGPWLVTPDELGSPDDVGLELTVNGAPRQKANTRDLIWSAAQFLAYAATGGIRLDDLRHRQIAGFLRRQLKAGRGKVTLNRCRSTLSSALTYAVRQRRLRFNPTRLSAYH